MAEFSWREDGGLHCNPVRKYIILSKYLIFFISLLPPLQNMAEFRWREEGGLHCNPVRKYIILSKYLIFFYLTSSPSSGYG
jgi:hypothetical protein